MSISQSRAARPRNGPTAHPRSAKPAASADGLVLTVSQHSAALARLRELIASEEMRSRGRLPPERELAERLGTSRRIVRHALGTLEAEGRIIRQQGRGTFIAEARNGSSLMGELARVTNPVDTLEARLAIEPSLARLAALRASRGNIDRLFEAAEASRTAADPASYEKADAAFHRRVAAATRNPLLIAIFDAVLEAASDGSWRHGRETAHCINNQAVYSTAHRRIAAAIAERNAALAEQAMRAHLSAVQQRLIEHAFSPSASTE